MNPIETAEGVTFTPFIEDHRVGYVITHPDGCTERVWIQPSTDTGEGFDTSNVFLYHADPGYAEDVEPFTHLAFQPHNVYP
ncbi:MAG: hypothetical protein JWO15_3925 [Sphingomonadales bacterium]|nr:hypothetical protein [Sphingomonadales bacterium]